MHSPENMPLPLKVEEGTTSQCVQACLETGKKDSSLKPTQEYISADPFQTFDHQTKICMVLSQYMCGDLFANRKLIQQWSVSTFHSSLLWHLHLLPLVLLLGVVWKPALLKPVPLVAALKVIETLGDWCCLSCLIKRNSVSLVCGQLRCRLEGYSP